MKSDLSLAPSIVVLRRSAKIATLARSRSSMVGFFFTMISPQFFMWKVLKLEE